MNRHRLTRLAYKLCSENAERNTATPEKVTSFVNTFFDNVKEKNLE